MNLSNVMEQALILSVVGLIIVFSVLALLTLFVHLMRRMDDGWQARERDAAAKAADRVPTIDATTLVLISAAVATIVQGRFVVRRVRRLAPLDPQGNVWSAQGRAVLHGSHVIVKRPRGVTARHQAVSWSADNAHEKER